MLSLLGSIASQSGIIRFQDIVIPAKYYKMKQVPAGGEVSTGIVQSPYINSGDSNLTYTNIHVEKGILYADASQAIIVMLEPTCVGGSALTYTYFTWYLDYTDGTTYTIKSISQTSYEVHGSYKTASAYLNPLSIGNKIPYRFRLYYSGGGWDSSYGNYSLDESAYFTFVKK